LKLTLCPQVLLAALNTALDDVDFVLKKVGSVVGEKKLVAGIDMVGLRMLAVAEMASIVGPCAEMVEDGYV